MSEPAQRAEILGLLVIYRHCIEYIRKKPYDARFEIFFLDFFFLIFSPSYILKPLIRVNPIVVDCLQNIPGNVSSCPCKSLH